MKTILIYRRLSILLLIFFFNACNNANSDTSSQAEGEEISKEKSVKDINPNPSKIKFEWLADPNEHAFDVKLPVGWKNDAYCYRVYNLTRNIATSSSPDGKIVLFFGDPKMPNYIIPTREINENSFGGAFNSANPLSKFKNYKAAPDFFEEYVVDKFGKLPKFKIVKKGECPEYAVLIKKMLDEGGMSALDIATTSIYFDYEIEGKPIHALVNGTTTLFQGFWMTGVNGISTTYDPSTYNEMMFDIVENVKHNPEWLAKEREMQNQRSRQMQIDHQNNMAAINASNQAHQIRMQNLHSSFEAHNQNWQQSQNTIDNNHGQFLNMIKEESTVSTPDGKTFQVDNSHKKYYINKLDNSYIGTDQYTTIDDLRRLNPNVDPNNYEEAQIIR